MIKIEKDKARPYSINKIQVNLPGVYVDDNNITPGTDLTLFRADINGVDALIIIPSTKENSFKNSNGNVSSDHSKNLEEVSAG